MESVVTQPAQQAGFTLIEFMIVMLIMAVFVTVGVPSFQNTIRENRLATHANELVSTFHFARSEAIKRRLPVAICRTVNGFACVTTGTAAWEKGWLVFVDDNGNGTFNSGTETLLRSVSGKDTSTLRANDSVLDDVISFRNNGLLSNTGGSFNLCDAKTADTGTGRNIAINVTGQVVTKIGSASVASCP